jgi:hypothetical protein
MLPFQQKLCLEQDSKHFHQHLDRYQYMFPQVNGPPISLARANLRSHFPSGLLTLHHFPVHRRPMMMKAVFR